MTAEKIREHLEAVPFRSFTIRMNGRHTCHVTDPATVSFSPDDHSVYVKLDGRLREILFMHHVAAIEDLVSVPEDLPEPLIRGAA